MFHGNNFGLKTTKDKALGYKKLNLYAFIIIIIIIGLQDRRLYNSSYFIKPE